MRSLVIIVSSTLLFQASAKAFSRKRPVEAPCPKIHVLKADVIDLSDTEKRLLCGDDETGRTARAWKNIPVAQAKTNFKNFLQDRGYFSPEFHELGGGVVEFDPGPRSRVEKITGQDLPKRIRLNNYRLVKGDPLTPGAVGTVKGWVKKRMQEEGYACAEIEALGDPMTGEINVQWLNVDEPKFFSDVLEDDSVGLATGAIRRYDAFKPEQRYSLVKTKITERRSTASRVVLSQDFEPFCSGGSVSLKETVHAGPPRLVSFGVGANTENILVAKAAWSHTRLGRAGSNFEVILNGSLREQRALARGDWYYRNLNALRQRLSPFAQFSHENERRYELTTLRTQALWQMGGEFSGSSWTFGVGPAWQNLRQLQGLGPRNVQYLTVKNEIGFTTHEFEYYATSPREGLRAMLTTVYVPFRLEDAGNPLSFSLEATALTQPGFAEPPWVVFGLRGRAFLTLLDREVRMSNVPVDFRRWTGGGQSVRGFGRYEIPDSEGGARLGAAGGFETRIPHILPFNLEPFFFVDGALLKSGESVNGEKTQAFWSPGLGLRWQSPIGAVRANVAHGYEVGVPDSKLSHFQFYLSLGEEF